MFDTITYEAHDGIGRLTLNRPERLNGMTNQMVREAHEACQAAAADPALRILVLTGAGKGFCPGADLGHFSSGEKDEAIDARSFHVATLLHEMPAVTIAAINGACAGAGLGWALGCDLRLAASSAKLNTAFLDVAVAGDMGGPWTLSRLVGAAKARELYFLPGRVTAEEAQRIGLVARVFPDETFRDDAEAIVQRLAAASPTALRGMKENFLAAERMGLREYIDFETERHKEIAGGPHAREAFLAFVEKRPPRFES
jgi:2-(1,2-epoxy-1,2-dihydrophenyl)acetyl-CoA isomerase